MRDSYELPGIAEPLFRGVNAEIEVVPAMRFDDVKRGLGAVTQGSNTPNPIAG
jgi:hypothetical protein